MTTILKLKIMSTLKSLETASKRFQQTKVLNFSSLQRQLRPFCKTTLSNSKKLLHVRLKDSKIGISLTLGLDSYIDCSYDRDKLIFSFHCLSNYDLVQKLLKHNLLN